MGRNLNALHVLSTPTGVEELLCNWYKFVLLPYDRADYGVADLLMDTDRAVELAELTQKQRQALRLVYMQGFTQEEVSKILDMERSAIAKLLARGLTKVSEVFATWEDYTDGGYGVGI